jgi:glucoamylase
MAAILAISGTSAPLPAFTSARNKENFMPDAPGGPGIPPRWTSSDKSGVGTALSATSRVWFTISHGILNECYYPRVDQACIRDFGLIVTDGASLFAEEKRDTESAIKALEDGVPAYELVNTHRPQDGGPPRFRIIKRIITDPTRDVVLQEVRLEVLDGSQLRLFALLAPHLVNAGTNNTAWRGDYKGQPMLFAEGGGTALAMASSTAFLARSVGYAGVNDGWQDLSRHFQLTWEYDRAVDGNVALVAELSVPANGPIYLALGFGRGPAEAAFRARASLQDEFARLAALYAKTWREWQSGLRALDHPCKHHNGYRVSTAVLRAHEAPSFPGGFIASLAIPWGASKGDDDLGGYHLVWPRDLVETAGGLLAAGAHAEAVRVLNYLRTTQEPDGHWPQNNWLDGSSYWQGVQMDECAFPILLVDMALRAGALTASETAKYWPMVRRAATFLVRNGPVTGQDRWEENSGYSTFTLAVEIAALLVAAECAERAGEEDSAGFLRDTADAWNAAVEDWCYVQGTPLAREVGVDGYYVRMAPDRPPAAISALDGEVLIKNRPDGQGSYKAHDIVSPDALALVRFGLRAANDPRILNTVRVIDAKLRVDLPAGPCWYRYNGDGYGEHSDGRPFDGTGIGRLWPLLTGERAHYALAAGDMAQATFLLHAMESFTSRGALIPEQIWDTDDIAERELFRGHPSGSAMPLVWAHAEYIKLLRSIDDGAVYDMPPQTLARYQKGQAHPRVRPWRLGFQPATLPQGRVLRVELAEQAAVLWSNNDWATSHETPAHAAALGIYVAELPTAELPPGRGVVFTWRTAAGAWAGADYRVVVTESKSY